MPQDLFNPEIHAYRLFFFEHSKEGQTFTELANHFMFPTVLEGDPDIIGYHKIRVITRLKYEREEAMFLKEVLFSTRPTGKVSAI